MELFKFNIMKTRNSEKYPEAWKFFIEHARNMEGTEFDKYGKYRISIPDLSGDFIYSNDVGILFIKFKDEFYKPSINSPSVYGKIQYIVEKF